MEITEIKRNLFKLYNEINKEVYGYGVTELKISFVDNVILFLTKDNRVHTLSILEEKYSLLKQSVDYALFTEFKSRFQQSLKTNMNIEAVSLHRDYDSNSKMAATVVVLDENAMKNLWKR